MRAAAPMSSCLATSGWWDGRAYREGVHEGLDLPAPVGTPVRAVADGIVLRVDAIDDSLAGRWVAIGHERGWISRYLHLSAVSVQPHDQVAVGQVIGLSGQTSTGLSPPHLHLELRVQPERLHDEYVTRYGTPTTGFGRQLGALGIAVPAEPCVAIDEYAPHVADRARAHGIPLRTVRLEDIPAGGIPVKVNVNYTPVLLAAGGAALVLWALW